MSTRREFLLTCGVLASGTALVPVIALASRPVSLQVPLGEMSALTLAEQIGTWFMVRDVAGGEIPLQLTAVEACSSSTNEGHEQFSMLFAGSTSQALGQNTYPFQHAAIGSFELFIVPVGLPQSTHCLYEAAFNRPTPAMQRTTRRRASVRVHNR
jgi:hypothetical protein